MNKVDRRTRQLMDKGYKFGQAYAIAMKEERVRNRNQQQRRSAEQQRRAALARQKRALAQE